jgi:hypothetical protein
LSFTIFVNAIFVRRSPCYVLGATCYERASQGGVPRTAIFVRLKKYDQWQRMERIPGESKPGIRSQCERRAAKAAIIFVASMSA